METTIRTGFRRLRWGLWRPSKRRYLWLLLFKFLKLWWNATWLYLGFAAVLSAFLAEKVTGEPTIILLCIAMVLAVRDMRTIRTNRIISILVVALGVAAAFLSLPREAKVGAMNLELWGVVGILIGVSAVSVLFFLAVQFRPSEEKDQEAEPIC